MYAGYEDVIARYPMMKEIAPSPAAVNSDFIYYAEIEINSRFASHFTVPFGGTHPTIKDLTIDLAYYRMQRIKDPEKAEKIHKAIIGRIDDIKAGKEYIYTGSGTTIAPTLSGRTGEIWSTDMDYHPVHSMLGAEHEKTRVSSEQLYDLEQERV